MAYRVFKLADTDTDTDTDKMGLQPICICVGVCVGQSEHSIKHITGLGYGYGLRLGFLFYSEIRNRDQSLNLCNVNMFCIAQCSSRPWNPKSESIAAFESGDVIKL